MANQTFLAGALHGKVALVTGGASGIGLAVVQRFVNEGAAVAVLDRSPERLEALAAECGDRVLPIGGDVTRFADNQRAVAQAVATFGQLNLLVANAGVFDCFASLADLDPDVLDQAFDQLFAVNVKGALLGAKAALGPIMASGGNMIFTLSNAAFYPAGGGALYTASKHALVGVVRQLAYELAPHVRVNGVAPGGTTSTVAGVPALSAFCAQRPLGQARNAHIGRRTPLRFAQEPTDHTGAYVLLASEQGRAITGVVIPSDGGLGIRGMPSYE